MIHELHVTVPTQGLHSITEQVGAIVVESTVISGLCTLFIQHTSASLLVQENYDPSAQRDLEHWLNRLVPENDPLYSHTLEGPDDMPAHIKAALTASSIAIPIISNQLALGSWQGIYLWEHRRQSSQRKILIHIGV